MNADPMIGGKSRAEGAIEEAPLLRAAKEKAQRQAYRNYAVGSVLLVVFAYVIGHFRPPSSGHEILVYVSLAWFGHVMYLYGKGAKS